MGDSAIMKGITVLARGSSLSHCASVAIALNGMKWRQMVHCDAGRRWVWSGRRDDLIITINNNQTKPALTRKSAMTHAGNVFFCDSIPLTSKINGFPGLIVERFRHCHVKAGDPSCSGFWDIMRQKQTDKQTEVNTPPPTATTVGMGCGQEVWRKAASPSCHPSRGRMNSSIVRGSMSQPPNGISIGSAILQGSRTWPTGRQTTLYTSSVAIARVVRKARLLIV